MADSAVSRSQQLAQQLAQQLQGLPQELYDSIYYFTFLSETSTVDVAIDSSYQVLSLRPDRANRSASLYYEHSYFSANDRGILTKWLPSLPQDHRSLLGDITNRTNESPMRVIAVGYRTATTKMIAAYPINVYLGQAGVPEDIVKLVIETSGEQ